MKPAQNALLIFLSKNVDVFAYSFGHVAVIFTHCDIVNGQRCYVFL